LRTANRFAGRAVYKWQLASVDGEAVSAGSGISVSVDLGLQQVLECDRMFLVSTNESRYFDDEKAFDKLVQSARKGCLPGSASSGSFIPARTGLLKNCRCTIHRENLPVFQELYPRPSVKTGKRTPAFTLYLAIRP